MQKRIKIGNRIISNDSPVFFIAEAGVNHNGSWELAQDLLQQAHGCGADCIKYQTFKADRVVTKTSPKAAYQLETTDRSESQLEMLQKLELPDEYHIRLKKRAEALGVEFLSTPYNFEDIDFLNSINVSAFKIASGQIVEHDFLKRIAETGKPIILSTGMATIDEIETALTVIRKVGNDQVVLLQCTTNYPSSIEDANLRVLTLYAEKFDCLVGYSDHTIGMEAIAASVALGACIVEKHFTLDKAFDGPDHLSSMVPDELRALVRMVRKIEKALGSGMKKPTQAEQINLMGMRRSIVALKGKRKGEKLKASDIGFKRPATGLSPKYYNQIIGRILLQDVTADELLQKDMIQW